MDAITSWLDATRAAPTRVAAARGRRRRLPVRVRHLVARRGRHGSDAAPGRGSATSAQDARVARARPRLARRPAGGRRHAEGDRGAHSAQSRLIQAGFRTPQSLRNFYGIKAILALSLPLVLLVAARWLPQLSTNSIVFYAVLARLHRRSSADHRARARCGSGASSACATASPMRSTCSSCASSRASVWRPRSSASRASSSSVTPSSAQELRSSMRRCAPASSGRSH